jgi:hypothetical protein
MKLTRTKYNINKNTFLGGYLIDYDLEGNPLSVDSHLYHSAKTGYYLYRTISQIWKERTWVTATAEEARNHDDQPRRRLLRVYRAMTAAQVVLMVANSMIPAKGGARKLAMKALEGAGIHS